MTRKPGEPIYLKSQMLALTLAVCSPILLPLLYHSYIASLSFATRVIAGVGLAFVGALTLYFRYRLKARNAS